MVLGLVGQSQIGDQDVVGPKPVTQKLPRLPLGGSCEVRLGRDQMCHRKIMA